MQIHELDNFNGALNSGAYVAVDNGTDTGKVSIPDFLAEPNEAISQLDTFLNGRIDNIIAGGAAPSASEIVDARYGADGVTYPSLGDAIRDQVTDLQSEITDITGVDVVGNWNNGYYLNLSGATVDVTDFTTNAAWRVSVTECSAGDVFYISAEGGSSPRAYAFVDVSGNILEVAGAGSTLDMEEKIAPTGTKYLVINDSGIHTSYKGMPVYLSIDKINESTASINDVVFTSVTGKYIDYEGTDAPAEAFARSNPIAVNKGDIVKFTARGYSTNVAMIATSNSAGTVFTPKVISVDATVRLYTYVVEEDGYIVVSYNSSYTHDLDIRLYYSNEALSVRIDQVDEKYSVELLSSFENITCIGDSLTYSQVYTGESTARQAYRPYPAIIADRFGANETILAEPGDSASQCWGRFGNSITEKSGQLTIIYLGTNGGLTDTMATDMVGDDYNNWANTNTGCYGKLIAKSLSVNSRVVLVKVYPQLTNALTTNSVIEAMGARFNVPVLDNHYMADLKYHSFPDGSDYNSVHYNDFGYAMFASQLMHNIDNLSDADIIKIIPL